MKNLITKTNILKISIAFLLGLISFTGTSQEVGNNDFAQLENLQNKKMDYVRKLNRIVNKYPLFSYQYNIKDGKVNSVTVTGIDNDIDTKQVKVILLDLQSNKNELKNKATRMGVFYEVDQEATYKGGREALNNTLHQNLVYPEGAKDWGIEGTIYVRFVVDEKGNIPYASTIEDIQTDDSGFYADQLKKQAISAIKKTSGDWEPGKIDGINVASFLVVPITFDLKKSPTIPFLLQ